MQAINTDNFTATIDFLRKHSFETPLIGIVLGTGLGGVAREIEISHSISYKDIPYFPVSTIESHSGKLLFGRIGNTPVVAMSGRFHYYEGYSMQEIVYPIRVMKLLGIKTLLLSNASGCVNLSYKKGDIVIIDDHINLQSSNPLIGLHDPSFGPRFPDMSAPYDATLIHSLWSLAKAEGIRIHKGVYVAVNGPNLETKAEYRFIKNIGGDVVGMSTVPEVIAAVQMGLRIAALSLVTDECDPENLKPVTLQEILDVAEANEPFLTKLIIRLITEKINS